MRLPLLIFAVLIDWSISEEIESVCNNDTEFDCQFGPVRCIPLEWMCDNVHDCLGGQDEGHCSYIHPCPTESLICRDGSCISSQFKCDGNADCPGGSDEAGCLHAQMLNISLDIFHSMHHNAAQLFSWIDKFAALCDKPKLKCNGGPCIDAKAICDGLWDCPHGEDERDCSYAAQPISDANNVVNQCPLHMTSCADGTVCIPTSWVCDGQSDCDDHSDEFDCDEDRSLMIDMQSNHHLCGYDEYRCSGGIGMCIPYNSTCNNIPDCPLGDDEGDVCENCKLLGCAWRCQISTAGPVCACPEGSRLSPDGHTCAEWNECENDGRRCQHFCENLSNGFECTCAPGYSLQKDGYSCRLDGATEGLLFVSLGSEIRSMPLSEGAPTSSYEVAQYIDNHGLVRSVSYMYRNKQLYMAVTGLAHEGELVVSSKGMMYVLRENIPGIAQVAVDWIGGNIFFTQKAPASNPGISVCNFNGFYCRQVIRGQRSVDVDPARRQIYRGLALDAQHGKIFWIEGYNNVHRIRMADMDGTNVETVLDSKLEYPSGLAIDPIRGDLYFGDVEKEMIECVNIHTGQRTVLLTSGVNHPHELVYFNGYLYWSDWGTESLKVAELTHHHSSSHVVHSFNRFPYGITINHPLYQPQANHDPCHSISCPWICVAVPGPDNKVHPKCVCPENYTPSRNSCMAPNNDREDFNISRISVSLMQQLCADGKACLNGGACENQRNEHGRVDRIKCVCVDGFQGDHCELGNQRLGTSRQEGSSNSTWPVLFICIAFLALSAGLFCLIFTNIDTIGSTCRRCASYIDERTRDSLPRSGGLSNLNDLVKGHIQSVTPRSISEELPGGVTSTFNNPMFIHSASEYNPVSSSFPSTPQGNFSNPAYDTFSPSVYCTPHADYEA